MLTSMYLLLSTLLLLGACSDSKFTGSSKTKTEEEPEKRPREAKAEPRTKPPTITSTAKKTHSLKNDIGDPETMELSEFKVAHFAQTSGGDGAPNWNIEAGGDVVLQSVNADASIFYHDTEYEDYQVEGYWQTLSSDDDDFMGFAFNLQDEKNFYLFSWKRGDQNSDGHLAKTGMLVRAISITDDFGQADLWASNDNPGRTKVLFSNSVEWEANTEYKFSLISYPGEFQITVENESGEVLAAIEVEDDTYNKGRFGFYNYSQPKIKYRGFAATRLTPKNYTYQVTAEDPDSDDLEFRLAESPKGMKIDKESGLIKWQTKESDIGKVEVTVIVSDGDGNEDKQTFELEISGAGAK